MTGRVLIVEDHRSLRRVLEPCLAAHGYQVAGAATGMSALDAARRQRPGLVILDLGLPDLDGLEVIARLRAFSAVPILVISARDAASAAAGAMTVGADDYLTKPFGIDELVGRVQAVLPPGIAGR
jgi:two-component system KDP operon response regulator KdpE